MPAAGVALARQTTMMAALASLFFLPMRLDECDDGGDPGSDCPVCRADFAIYDPNYEDDGVWEEEVTALITLMDDFGWSYEIVDTQDINNGILGVGDDRRYRALIGPGGYAWPRNRDIQEEGEAGILAFIDSGGNYVGFCAGTYHAADEVVWAEEATGGGGTWNRPEDYQSYAYDLGLFEGSATGPFGWTPWDDGTGASLQPVRIDTSIETMATIGIGEETRFFYYGGPFFTVSPDSSLSPEVWARAVRPDDAPEDADIGADEATIIHYMYGDGHVILFSYHPEILINSDVDGITLSDAIDETTMTWDTGDQTWDEINLQSWNIVHAALQIAANEEVEALTELP